MKITYKSNLLRSTMIAGAISLGMVGAPMLGTVAFAQDYTSGGINGTVFQPSGEVAAGVEVTLTSTDRGFVRTSVSDSNGKYRFTRLPIGNYSLGATGGETYDVKVAVGTNTQKSLAASGTLDEVVATGTVVKAFDFESATTGLTIDVDATFKVTPIARNLTALTLLTPGVTGGDSAFGNLASLGGSSVAENVYYVNGMNTTDFRNFLGSGSVPFEFYSQVQTKTGGLPAEFGRTTGGVSNAVTKSGTNEWHFGASVFHENKDLRADAKNTELLVGGDIISANKSEIRESTEYNFWASGPIIEDRVFAYGLYSPRKRVSTGNLGPAAGNKSTTFTSSNPFYGGKVDIVLTDDHLVELTGWRNFNSTKSSELGATFDAEGNLTGTSGTPLIGFSDSGGEVWSAKYTGQITDYFNVSVMYGEQTNDQTVRSDSDGNPAIRDRRNPALGFVDVDQAANFNIDIGDDKRKLFRADADLYVNDMFGDHHFRFGFDKETLTANSATINSGGVYYVLFDAGACDSIRATPTGDECTRVREFKSGGEFDVETTAFYLQDSWSVTEDLTLNLGIRNEKFENFNGTGDSFISIPNQWAPRLGFSYHPEMDPNGTLFGSFSRYFLPVAANTNIRSSGAETFIHRWYELDSVNADFTPNFDPATIFATQIFGDGTAPTPESLVDANIKPQSMDEYILGYRTDLGDRFDGELGNWSVGAAFTYNKINRVIEDISIDQGVLQYCDDNGIAGCAANFGIRTLNQYVLTNPGFDVNVVVDDLPGGPQRITLTAEQLGYPKAKRTYNGFEFTFDRVNASDGLNLHGSWTISNSSGNYEGAVKSDNGQDDTGLTTDFDFTELAENADGKLPNHRAHKFKLYGDYRINEAITVGANLRVTSPRKFGCLGEHPSGANTDLYGRSWFCGGVATPRGSQLESDWEKQLDLNLGFTVADFPVGELHLRVDVFNVFNSQSTLDLKETGDLNLISALAGNTDPEYGRTTRYQSPRYVRLGADWRF